MKFVSLLLLGFLCTCQLLIGQTVPVVEVTGDQLFCGEEPMPILTDVNLISFSGPNEILEEVFVQIVEGYSLNEDFLFLSENHPNISWVWLAQQARLRMRGPATSQEFEDALRDVRYRTTQVLFEKDKTFAINLGRANYLPATGHYYLYIQDVGVSWPDARDAAEGMTYFGLQGYLVTVTSQEEAEFTGERTEGTGWIGASDSDAEGVWRWVSGPESGQVFWNGDASGSSPPGMFSFWNQGEPNNFDDEDYAHITDPSIGRLGSWNDLKINGDPPGPYHPQGYIVEFGGFPGEPDILVSGTTIIRTPRFSSNANSICEEGLASIEVNSNVDTVDWYASEDSDVIIGTGLVYEQNISSTTTFWASAYFGDCSDGPRIPITVEVFSAPIANDISITQCDDEESDGITVFRLNNYSEQILEGNDTSDLEFIDLSFYEDSDLLNPISGDAYENTTSPQTVYALATNTLTNCQSVSELIISVSSSSDTIIELNNCDDFVEDGFVLFDLTEATDQLLPTAPINSTIAYYRTYGDALLENNPVSNPYFNEVPYHQEIFARISLDGNCYSINTVRLTVSELPEVGDFETVYYCLNTFPQPIKISGAVLNDIPNNYYYNWSTGETTIEIEVNQVGEYEVLVTEVNGCTNRKIISVEPSEIAIINEIDISGSPPFNTVVVQVEGTGDYEYSIESEIGPFQTSNIFQNVSAGVKTVYVRDVRGGCGISSQEISIIGYPRFFTPNGDGQNDTWGIKGFNSKIPFTGRVRVFDRLGKLLVELSDNNAFWDGSYQGSLLPSNDYWFIAELDNGQTITGHFSLRR